MSFGENFDYGRSVLNSFLPKKYAQRHQSHHHDDEMIHSLSKSSINNKGSNSVVHLKQLILKFAESQFKAHYSDYSRSMGSRCNWNELTKEIDWTNFRIRQSDVEYTDLTPKQPKSQVLFKTTYVNNTDTEQEYELSTERKTQSECSFELLEGFTNEGEIELAVKVPIPGCALEAGAGFKHEYSLESTRTKSITEEMNWTVKSTIKVNIQKILITIN